MQDAWATTTDAFAHGLNLVWPLGHHRQSLLLVVPAETGDVETIAKHDAGLYSRSGAGQPAAPRCYDLATLGQ